MVSTMRAAMVVRDGGARWWCAMVVRDGGARNLIGCSASSAVLAGHIAFPAEQMSTALQRQALARE
jgi:hypothetical protein